MPTCLYHGNQKPCRTCAKNHMAEFAHAKGKCSIHGEANPCLTCYDGRTGEFTVVPLALPVVQEWIHPQHGHAHGADRPCKIRCGANEGLSILNTEKNVSHLFTDGLISCTQVILRNDKATFTCHIYASAEKAVYYIKWAVSVFVEKHGEVDACYVASGDGTGAIDKVIDALREKLVKTVDRKKACGGYAIEIANGEVTETPSIGWGANRREVAGWTTAVELICGRYTWPQMLGNPLNGDYLEACRACNS